MCIQFATAQFATAFQLIYGSFNTIQYDIDLKHIRNIVVCIHCFNTIQYDIDLKLL